MLYNYVCYVYYRLSTPNIGLCTYNKHELNNGKQHNLKVT